MRLLSRFILVCEGVFLLGFSIFGILFGLIFISEFYLQDSYLNMFIDLFSGVFLIFSLILAWFLYIWIMSKGPLLGRSFRSIWKYGIYIGFALTILALILSNFEIENTFSMMFSAGALFIFPFCHLFIEYKLQSFDSILNDIKNN